jgi:hypothetical protein
MPRRHARKWKLLAALTTGLAYASGLGCIQQVLASIGATFF